MSRTRLKTAAGAVVVVAVLAGLLVSLDFQAAQSLTEEQHQISKFAIGVPQGQRAELPRTIDVYVAGEDPLATSLRRELGKASIGEAAPAGITLLDSIPERMTGRPTLIVELPDRNVTWTPVYARSALTTRIVYASDGDMSWRDEFTVRMDNRNGPQIRVRGDLSLADTTRGVVSEPAYRRHLADQIAASVGNALKQQLSS